MPLYLFESKNGATVERFYQVDSAPKIGELIRHSGRWYKRVPSFVIGSVPESKTKYPYVSRALPTTIKGCPRVQKNGRSLPIVKSKKHERELMTRYDLTKESACFDGGDLD